MRIFSYPLQFTDAVTTGGGGITGTVDGVNRAFGLPFTPSPTESLLLIWNDTFLGQGLGYTLAGKTVTIDAAYTPQTGDRLTAYCRHNGG